MTAKKESYIIPNLDRALRAMELLSEHPEGLTMTGIADALSIPKNSAFRIATTLEHRGFLERNPTSKAFCLTNKLTNISHATLAEKSLVQNAWEAMQNLRDECGETILLGTIIDHQGVVLEQAEGSHNFKFTVNIGTRFELHTAAPGKAMLAFLPQSSVNKILAKMTFTKFNKNTIDNVEDYQKELAVAKSCGYGVDCDEEHEGMRCIGAPVFNEKKIPIAALWLTGPSSRIHKKYFKALGQKIIHHAATISKKLGA